jgi:hypothetical protein
MLILLQDKRTLRYVEGAGSWTSEYKQARVFATGLQAILFCYENDIQNMQLVGGFADRRLNFAVPVTDERGD